MAQTETPVQIDADKLMAFVFRAVDEVGAALNCALVVMGDQLGYYRDLAAHGPTIPSELAGRTGTGVHYAREWLNAQAAGGFVEYDASTRRYTLPPEHAVALTDESSPAFLPGFFQIAHGTARDAALVIDAARTATGLGWDRHNSDVHAGCERFFRPGYAANLVSSWLPALDGVVDKLDHGAKVADVGCGHGASTVLMAEAYPRSSFAGSDYHAESIATAQNRASDAAVGDRTRFEIAAATIAVVLSESELAMMAMAELRLLPYLQTHLTSAEIAERLFVSQHTVRSQVSSIYRKLGAFSRDGAVQQATAIGLLGR